MPGRVAGRSDRRGPAFEAELEELLTQLHTEPAAWTERIRDLPWGALNSCRWRLHPARRVAAG